MPSPKAHTRSFSPYLVSWRVGIRYSTEGQLPPEPQGQRHPDQVILGSRVDELRPSPGQGGLWVRSGINQATQQKGKGREYLSSTADSLNDGHSSVYMCWETDPLALSSVAEIEYTQVFQYLSLPRVSMAQHLFAYLKSTVVYYFCIQLLSF